MQEVNFYAWFFSEEKPKQARCQLEEFLQASTPLLTQFGCLCKIVWEKHPLAPEPNDLLHSYPTAGCLQLPFSFQYVNLEHALRKVELLKALLSDLAREAYLGFECEYHLDDCLD